jgi:hypothetical protein
LQKLLKTGLEATARLWPALQVVYAWVWRAAHVLGDKGPGTAAGVRRQLGGLLGAMVRHRAAAGYLGTAVNAGDGPSDRFALSGVRACGCGAFLLERLGGFSGRWTTWRSCKGHSLPSSGLARHP